MRARSRILKIKQTKLAAVVVKYDENNTNNYSH